jgi:hypothetical protein
MDELIYFAVGGVLAAGSKEVTKGAGGNAAVSALVEEGEGFFIVRRGLRRERRSLASKAKCRGEEQ